MQELFTPIHLFTLRGVRTSVSGLSLLSGLILVPLFTQLAMMQLHLSFFGGLQAGLEAVLGLFISDWLHQWGHARAARHTGYPMTGIHFFFAGLSISQYPEEPPLPPKVHIRRALGGFWVNLLIGALILLPALVGWTNNTPRGWSLMFLLLHNVFILGLGSLLPLDIPGKFTLDGGILLRLTLERWRKPKS